MSRWTRLAPLTGVAFFALLLASFIVGGSTPGTGDSGQSVINFYTAHKDKEMVSAFLGFYAVVFFLFFAGVLRARLRKALPESALPPISFAGAIFIAIAGSVFASVTIALTDVPDKLGPDAAQALNLLVNDFFAPLIAGVCVFMIANGIATLRYAVLPAWLGWIAILIGIVAVTPIGFFGFLAMAIWTLIVSVLLYARTGAERSVTPPPASSVT
jgi:hypothetical protein